MNGRADLPGYQAFKDGATVEGSQRDFHHIDPQEVENKSEVFKLLVGGILPRPVAFCSTISRSGIYGLAPFSYFAPMGYMPPLIMLYFSCTEPLVNGGGRHRDTLNNIKATKEFVVNASSEPYAEAVNYASIDCPPGVSEWELTGLTQIPSDKVKPPRIGESPFCMECTLEFFHDVYADGDQKAQTGTMVAGRVVQFHVRKDIIGHTGAIDTAKLLPISKLGGISYGRTTDIYESPKPFWKEHLANYGHSASSTLPLTPES